MMKTIDVWSIPTFQESGVNGAVQQLRGWFDENGYSCTVSTTPSGYQKLTVQDLDWHQYAFRGDTDPVNGLLEPWDESTMIFVKQ